MTRGSTRTLGVAAAPNGAATAQDLASSGRPADRCRLRRPAARHRGCPGVRGRRTRRCGEPAGPGRIGRCQPGCGSGRGRPASGARRADVAQPGVPLMAMPRTPAIDDQRGPAAAQPAARGTGAAAGSGAPGRPARPGRGPACPARSRPCRARPPSQCVVHSGTKISRPSATTRGVAAAATGHHGLFRSSSPGEPGPAGGAGLIRPAGLGGQRPGPRGSSIWLVVPVLAGCASGPSLAGRPGAGGCAGHNAATGGAGSSGRQHARHPGQGRARDGPHRRPRRQCRR